MLVVANCPVRRWSSSLFNFSPLYCGAIVGLRKKLYKPLQTSKNIGQLAPQTERGQLLCAIGGSYDAHMVFPCLPSSVAVVEPIHVCRIITAAPS